MCPGGALPTSVVLVICIFQCFVALFIGCCLDHPSYLALHGIAMELDTFRRRAVFLPAFPGNLSLPPSARSTTSLSSNALWYLLQVRFYHANNRHIHLFVYVLYNGIDNVGFDHVVVAV